MSATVDALLDHLQCAYDSRRALLLLFDYDGTLVPLVEHPRLAQVSQELRRLLGSLARQPRLAVGIVSGRALDDLQRLVRLPPLYYAGTGGLELDLRGERILPPRAWEGEALIHRVVRALHQQISVVPGAWIEPKRFGFTLHFRAVAAEDLDELLGRARPVLDACADRLRVVPGPRSLEATLDIGWDKATAARRILDEVGPEAGLLVAGDEPSDDVALRLANELDGIAVGVGPRAPASARYRLPDPAALRRVLQRFLRQRSGQRDDSARFAAPLTRSLMAMSMAEPGGHAPAASSGQSPWKTSTAGPVM
jgi:trehalose-phosphatase